MLVLESERLLFREWEPKDTPRLKEILTDPVTMQFWPHPYDAEGVKRWQEKAHDRYRGTGIGRFAVILKGTNEIIGDAGIMESEVDGKEEFDLGYIIHHPYWGKGYATEAAAALLEHGFRNLKMYRIVVNMAEEHGASRHVAEKIGMPLEKQFINTRNLDKPSLLYALSRKGYLEMRQSRLFNRIAETTEKRNWLALATSEDNASRLLALESAAGIREQLQTELLHWFCSAEHFVTRGRIFELLDDRHKAMARAAIGPESLPQVDHLESFAHFQAAKDPVILQILAEMEFEGTPLPNYKFVFVKKFRARTGKGMEEGKAELKALMQRARAYK